MTPDLVHTHTHTKLYFQSYTHFYLGKSLKLIWEKFRVFWTVLIESLSVCVCDSELKLNMCAHTHTHTHARTHARTHTPHTHTYSMTKPPSLSGHSLHLPRQQCLSFVCLHFSLFYLLKKSCILFPQSKSSHKKEFTPTRDQQISQPLCACDLFKRSALPEKMHVTVRANPKIESEILCLYSTGL